MGIFDFFKSRKEKEEPKNTEVIAIGELGSWIENKSTELKNQKTEFHALVKNRVSKLSDELRHGTESFKNIDWQEIKVEERIKKIVKENLNNYESHLGLLIQELNKLEESSLNKEKIYLIFSAFEKRAAMNYQKSTYLIGKELESINKSMSTFFKDIDRIYNENNDFLNKIITLSHIEEGLKELEESDKTIAKIRDEINQIEEKITISENKIKNSEIIASETKKGTEYFKWKEKAEKFQERTENLKQKIQALGSMIDFKALARIWHENPPEMNLITEYRSNFNLTFHKDKGGVLTKLINSLENKEVLNDAISKINDLEEEIKNTNTENDPVLIFEKEIQKIKEEISSLQEIKSAESKKADKLILARAPTMTAIVNSTRALNSSVVVSF